MLAKSPIIILDDSLSALDTQTDRMIQEALDDYQQELTMLMITHRISSAKKADFIIVLEDGQITQQGTHAQLIQQEGLYKRIYELQNEGGESDGDERTRIQK